MNITRRKFFAQMRKLGFSKSRIQLTRVGITYSKGEGSDRVSVTVPKGHDSTFTIVGNVPYSGIFVHCSEENRPNWGTHIPEDWDPLQTCLDICSGAITPAEQG